MIHPMQYDLERAYHNRRQQAAARQRFVAEAERQTVDTSTSVRLADAVVTRIRSAVIRGVHPLAVRRRQVAEQEQLGSCRREQSAGFLGRVRKHARRIHRISLIPSRARMRLFKLSLHRTLPSVGESCIVGLGLMPALRSWASAAPNRRVARAGVSVASKCVGEPCESEPEEGAGPIAEWRICASASLSSEIAVSVAPRSDSTRPSQTSERITPSAR